MENNFDTQTLGETMDPDVMSSSWLPSFETCCYIFLFICLIVAIWWNSLMLSGVDEYRRRKIGVEVRTLIVAGSGGHTSEVLRLISGLSKQYYPRTYVVAGSDKTSPIKIRGFEANYDKHEGRDYDIVTIPRPREVLQSWATSLITFIYATYASIPVIVRARPELIICNGPGTCIPICIVVALYRILRLIEGKVIFVESICRVKSMSFSGQILYHGRLAHKIVVQWADLLKDYPRAEFFDRLV